MQYYCIIPRYAASRIEALREANQLKPKSRFASWKPVDMVEMRAFFSIILNMGLIEVLTLEGYWSTSWECEIPCDRFLQILWMLHVGDGPKRADKVQGLLDALIGNFQTAYYPSKDVAVDETMVGFRVGLGQSSICRASPTSMV